MRAPRILAASAFHRHRTAVTTLIVSALTLGLVVGVAHTAGARPADKASPIGRITSFSTSGRKVTVRGWAYQPGVGSAARVHIVENRYHYQSGADPKYSIHTFTTLRQPSVARAHHTGHTLIGFQVVVGQPHGLAYGTDRICMDADVHVARRIITTHLGCRVFAFTAPRTSNYKVLAYAKTFMNRNYHYSTNAAGPRAFDCSGFTTYVYRRVTGKHLPHSAQAQYASSRHIASPEPGDLVFYLNSAHHAFHVGIYAGRQNYKHRGVMRPVMAAAIDTAEDMGYQAMIKRSGARYIVFGTFTH